MNIEELRGLLADCKPCGKWVVTDTCSDYVFKIVRAGTADIDAGNDERAALIVAAVNSLPALLSRLEDAEAVVEAAGYFARNFSGKNSAKLQAALTRYQEAAK